MTPHVLGTCSVRVTSLMGKSSIIQYIIVGGHLPFIIFKLSTVYTQSPERAVVVVDL